MVAVGEIFLGAFLQVLFQKLMSRELLNFARGEGVHKKLKKWSSKLRIIQAVLSDAEEKQLTDEAVKLWLDDLRDLAYDVEDVLDKFYTELLRREIENSYRGSASKVWSLIPTCCTSSTPSALGLFMLKMDSEINEITVRLQDITQRKSDLGLNAIERSVIEWKRPPTSSLPDGQVIGRDEHKMKIVQLLLTDQQSNLNFDVVAIVGMPGVGKTTLAGLVFHDDAVKEHFDIRVWIYVSVEFDYVRLTKAILQTIKPESANNEEFSKLQERLIEELTGKKFLFVLDDVWNTKNDLHDLWVTMRPPFRGGAPGSKIIVTTRDESAAKLMGAVGHHNLDCVSRDDWWEIFVEHAFLTSNTSEQQNLGSLRDEILAKCDGLPLSARALGGLLCCKEIDEWKEVLENKLWTQPEHSNIPSLLKLSYHYLPPHVKRCFAYCSIFPEDYEFKEKQLILLWMAEGLLQNPKGSTQMEVLGRDYFRVLFSRSFFQKSKKHESKYVMHDLFNELARSVAGEIGFRLEDKEDNDKRCRSFEKFRHSAYFSAELEGMQRLEVFSNLEHLRTFLPLSHSYDWRKYLTSNFTLQILPKLQYLRVLSMKGYCIRELPDSIGKLKLLRYLDLSYTGITSLPESICHLYNLQTLLLEDCDYLNALPTGLKNLINLRHLIFSNKWHRGSLKGMPSNMGKLTNLRTLSYFVVGEESSSSGIGELGPLLHLYGTLQISGLENVNGVEDAAMANLAGKDGIDVLLLQWNDGAIADPDIFESLQPPRMLKELTVMGYGGSKFPAWMGNSLFSKMVKMRLEDCRRCKMLPPLGQLPLLKELTIGGLSGVESVGSEFYGDGGLNAFPLLETLCFEDMKNWKDWFPDETNNGIDRFPQLKKLVLNRCPSLKGKLPESLPSLKDLEVFECEQLTVSIPSSQMLCMLFIGSCAEVVCANHAHLKSLKSVNVFNIRKFRYQPEKFMQGLTKEENLVVPGCNDMTPLLQDTFCQLTSFRKLRIKGSTMRHLTLVAVPGCNWITSLLQYELHQLASRCLLQVNDSSLQYLELDVEETEEVQFRIPKKLETLSLSERHNLLKVPEGLQLTLLKELHIVSCPRLTSISESSLPSSLKALYIQYCENLKSALVLEEYSSINSNCTLNCLESLTIKECRSLESITSANLPVTLRQLEVWNCPSLICLSSSGELPKVLEVLDILSCNRLTSLSLDDKLPKALKRLKICECPSLICLSSSLELPEALEVLHIEGCHRLTSLVSDDKFPKALKDLHIFNCGQLKWITNRFYGNTCLQSLHISYCKNLTSLPEGLHHLTNLSEVDILDCENLVSFPEGGLPASNLRELNAPGTILSNMVANPRGMQGFPLNLTSLTILDLNVSKPLFQWGLLHRLTSLKELNLFGKGTDMVSFPPEDEKDGRKGMMLPKSLIILQIGDFENLEKFSTTLQCLTSLQKLYIINCEKLKFLPEGGLLRSLLKLEIDGCKLLEEKYKRDTGPFWPCIAHIPYVVVGLTWPPL